MISKAKIKRHAQQMMPAGGTFIVFEYDGIAAPLWGWASVSSPLGRHILGTDVEPVFECYQNPRSIEVYSKAVRKG